MSNNLYSEAIDAAEQLKHIAESKVKQQIIEAMSPHIKNLVEKQLMEDNQGNNANFIDEPDVEGDADGSDNDPDGSDNDPDGTDNGQKTPAPSECVTELSEESRNIISSLITQSAKQSALKAKLDEVRRSARSLEKAIIIAESKSLSDKFKNRIVISYKNLLAELANIKSSVILKKDSNLLNEYIQLSKEIENMSTRQSKNGGYLTESLEKLLEINLFEDEAGEEDDSEADEASFDLGDLDTEAESDSAVTPETTVQQLADMAGIIAEEPEEEAEEPEEPEEPEEEGDEGDELVADGQVFEIDDVVEDDIVDENFSHKKDLFLEIDENMLKREISKMKRLREGDAGGMASHFGGGKLTDEMFVDYDEVNKLDKLKTEAAKVVRINRTLKSKLSQYKKALQGMKGQLSEMNLFNAKLLYANKLMQNNDITIKQQRNIVESLDEAKTLSEAKLLFESLTKSLTSTRRTSSKQLAEGSLRSSNIGSSSRSTKSSQTLKEGVALDRWATLAGIKK